jgi:hypothetical protein
MPKMSKTQAKAAAKAAEEAAKQAAITAEKKAALVAKQLAEQQAEALEAAAAKVAEQNRLREEHEASLLQDKAEKEALAMKLQAVHRGRAARKAAKDAASSRHEVCDVRQKVHGKSMENPLADDGMFEQEEKVARTDLSSADDNVVESRALYCLGQESGVRHTFNDFLNHKFTTAFLLGCILLNVVILSVETPTSTNSQDVKDALHLADLLLSIIFSSKHAAFVTIASSFCLAYADPSRAGASFARS